MPPKQHVAGGGRPSGRGGGEIVSVVNRSMYVGQVYDSVDVYWC